MLLDQVVLLFDPSIGLGVPAPRVDDINTITGIDAGLDLGPLVYDREHFFAALPHCLNASLPHFLQSFGRPNSYHRFTTGRFGSVSVGVLLKSKLLVMAEREGFEPSKGF